MQSVQTSHLFSLTSVKPLDGLFAYRKYCLEATRKVLTSGDKCRCSPIDGTDLEFWAEIEGLAYYRCPKTDSLFLGNLPDAEIWGALLKEINQYRHAKAFHREIKKLRIENVYMPKLTWIENALRVQGLKRPRVLEITTPPGDFTVLLEEKGICEEVKSVSETDIIRGRTKEKGIDVAILLESLDRVAHPDELLKSTRETLKTGGLVFVTALVSSGFDMMILGKENAYLYPPDRTNFFSLTGLKEILVRNGFHLLEVSTPGVLDVEVVETHRTHGIKSKLSGFEEKLFASDAQTKVQFQKFLQQSNMSSFARIVARKG